MRVTEGSLNHEATKAQRYTKSYFEIVFVVKVLGRAL